MDSQWEFALWCRELKPNALEEGDGVGGGKEVQEGGDVCILKVDSCLAEASTIL